jgi:hypothetical protein
MVMMRRIQRNDFGIEFRVGVNMNILLFSGVLRCIPVNGTERETRNGPSGGVFVQSLRRMAAGDQSINLE